MKSGRTALYNLGLVVLGGLILLQDKGQPAECREQTTPGKEQATDKPSKPDTDVLLDRMATRFGAFAVVATVTIPISQAANAIRLASRYNLPALGDMPVWVACTTISLHWIMMALAVVLALLAFSPVLALVQARKWWTVLLIAPVFVSGIVLYMVLVVMMLTQHDLNPLGEMLWDMMRDIDKVCGQPGLTGQACEDALNAANARR